MSEEPRYVSVPSAQAPIFDEEGIHVGYVVSVKFQKGSTIHEESTEVILGASEAAIVAAYSMEEYSTWNHGKVLEHNLVSKANLALDALP